MPLIAWKFNRFEETLSLYLVALGHWQFLLLPLLTVYAKRWAVIWLQPASLSWVPVKLSALTPQQTVSPGKEELQGEVRVFRPIRCWKIVLWNYYLFDTNLNNNLRPSPKVSGKTKSFIELLWLVSNSLGSHEKERAICLVQSVLFSELKNEW